MQTVLIVIHLLVVLALIGVVLLQKSEGGALGIGGGGGGGFMTSRGTANVLTRATAILGGLFIMLSIALAAVAGTTGETTTIDTSLAREAPVTAPAPTAPAPAPQQAPAVPIAQ